MTAAPIRNLPRATTSDRTVRVLGVSAHESDHIRLRAIFSHSNWHIHQASNCREALDFLRTNEIAVLVCEEELPDGNWKELLDSLVRLPESPLLVVTSDDARTSLWAEALNLGAYDVLSKPFDSTEVTRIISLAWLHWKEHKQCACHSPAGPLPEERTDLGAGR